MGMKGCDAQNLNTLGKKWAKGRREAVKLQIS